MAEPPSPSQHHHRNTTLNAVSFGFIATAVLFAMFLIIAIFERVLRPHRPFRNRGPTDEELQAGSLPQGAAPDSLKPELCHVNSYSRSISVVMPGYDYPTYFAKPIPSPLPPEGLDWPSHGAESSQHDPEALQPTAANGSQKGPALARTSSNSSKRWTSLRKSNASSS